MLVLNCIKIFWGNKHDQARLDLWPSVVAPCIRFHLDDNARRHFFILSWWILWWKNLNHIGLHVDIKACSKRAIDEMLTLINPMESHFCASLVSKNTLSSWWCVNLGSMSSSLSAPKIYPCVSFEEFKQCVPFSTLKKKN